MSTGVDESTWTWTYLCKERWPDCIDDTSRNGVLITMSDCISQFQSRIDNAGNVPTLSCTPLSARVAAVALLNSTMRHFLP